jgi:hypothetical protein
MAETFRLLHGPDGLPVCVQVPYDEVARLEREIAEGLSLKARLRRAAAALSPEPDAPAHPDATAGKAKLPNPVEEKPIPAAAPPPVPAAGNREIAKPAPAKPAPAKAEKPPAREIPAAVQIPATLQSYMSEQDPSGETLRLIESCIRGMTVAVGRRITVSLHRPYICFWDFDVWRIFACGEIRNGQFYLSVDRMLAPETSDVWNPPSGVFKSPMARMRVDRITDDLICFLRNAVDRYEPAAV